MARHTNPERRGGWPKYGDVWRLHRYMTGHNPTRRDVVVSGEYADDASHLHIFVLSAFYGETFPAFGLSAIPLGADAARFTGSGEDLNSPVEIQNLGTRPFEEYQRRIIGSALLVAVTNTPINRST